MDVQDERMRKNREEEPRTTEEILSLGLGLTADNQATYHMQNDTCHLQINDYMVASPVVEYLLDPNDGTAPAAEEAIQLAANAAQAEELCGSAFTPMVDMWKQGDSAEEYSKVFLVRYGIYPDDGYESSEPMTDPAQVTATTKRGNVLRFEWNAQGLYNETRYMKGILIRR